MKIRFSAEALEDLDNHLDYYGKHSARAKQDFWDQIQDALRLISQYPALSP